MIETVGPLALLSFDPLEEQAPNERPLVFEAVFDLMEEIRIFAAPRLSKGRIGTLPKVPLTKEEVNEMLHPALRREEKRVFAHLATRDRRQRRRPTVWSSRDRR